jgi:HEAT repeat protein
VLVLVCACQPWAWAQEGGPEQALPPVVPASDLGPAVVPDRETEAETIRRCLDDVRSDDVRLRRRAVMILGKYRAPSAMGAVTVCLRDEDAEVRRSAAVAVSEWDVLPAPAQSEVLRLVLDPSVQVRRVASSMLSDILGGRFAFVGGGVVSEDIPVVLGSARVPAAQVAEILNAALGDEDLTVRRNVLTAARYAAGVLQREALEPCLRDADREVRILAIQAYAQLRGAEAARGEVLAAAAADVDSLIRREAAQALGRLGAGGFAGLERLATDSDPGVRIRAARELVQLQHPRGLDLLERSMADETIPAEERRGLLVYTGFYGESARPLLTRLSTDRSALLRAEALRGLARLAGAEGGGPEFFLPCLEDESPEVRRTAAQSLTRWAASHRENQGAQAWPTAAGLGRLLTSVYPDVRILAVRLATALEAPARLDVLTEACLDDDSAVRCEAILHLAILGDAEALALVSRSLDDPKTDVMLAAVRALSVRPTAQSRQLLQAFHDRCSDPSLKAAVATVLSAMGGSAPGLVRPSRWPLPRTVPAPPSSTGGPVIPLRRPLPNPVPDP